MTAHDNLNHQQFFHGSRAQLSVGDSIEAGHAQIASDVFSSGEHNYFTSSPGLAAGFALRMPKDPARNSDPAHVYTVKPTGKYVQDRKVEGGRAYKSTSPLRITGVSDA